jgi:hypothetical protein
MVLKFVMLSDEDESFIREFEFLDSHTLLDFHNAIQSELEFDKSQLASFFITSDNWEKEEEFTLFDMGANSATMEETLIDDVIIKKNQKLLYVFDYFNDRALFIEYTGEAKEDEDSEYPVCTGGKGEAPRQVFFGSRSKKKFNNITVSDDDFEVDEVDVPEVDGLFLNEEDEDSISDYSEEEEDDISVDDVIEDEEEE